MKIDPTISDLYIGDARKLLRRLPDGCVQTCVTSPPYWGLRDYDAKGQIGLESSPEAYVAELVKVLREVYRVLAKDGTLWLNLGDSFVGDPGGFNGKNNRSAGPAGKLPRASSRTFMAKTNFKKRGAGLKPKDLVGIPWMVAFALRADGWYLRSDIIWHKPNPMPESVADRPARAHEYIFLLSKSERYYYNGDAIREPLQPKTLTTYGTTRKSKGTDSLGKVAADNWANDVPVRQPKLDEHGDVMGATKRSVWSADEVDVESPPRQDRSEREREVSARSPAHPNRGTAFPWEDTDGHRTKRSVWSADDEAAPKRYRAGNKERSTADVGTTDVHREHMGRGVPWEDTDGHRTKRSVWKVAAMPYAGAHFATFPPDLIEPCILAGSRPGDLVLDPFFGSGTTGEVAEKHERLWIGFDIQPKYEKLQRERTAQRSLPLARAAR